MTRSIGINILRLLTALSVLFTHFGLPVGGLYTIILNYHSFIKVIFWSNKGLHFGVIIFVVLSGFLIHATSQKLGKIEYLLKRFIRIYPLFFISSIVGLLSSNKCEYSTFFYNVTLLSAVIPFDRPPGNPILITVIVEIVIYMCYLFLRNYNTYNVLFCLFIAYIFNIFLYSLLGVGSEFIQRNLFSLLFYWYIGASSFEYFIKYNNVLKLKNVILLFVFYVLISNFFYFKGVHYLYSIILAVISSFTVVIIYRLDIRRIYSNSIFIKVVNFLGESSYSIYVWHIIIMDSVLKYFIVWNTKSYIISILITLITASLSYIFIEKFFMNKKKWLEDFLFSS